MLYKGRWGNDAQKRSCETLQCDDASAVATSGHNGTSMRSSIQADEGNAIDCPSVGSSAPDPKALAGHCVSGIAGSPA